MAANALVQTRIDDHVKAEAASVLKEMGLTISDAVRLMLVRVARDKEPPFDVRTPNATTIAAMEEGRRGGLRQFASVDELFADLNEED